uniref:Aminotransferase class I/classII large domain-containing protein n=1 Tax=Bionectria ochroleuca TaxID=29856 RepID=A0A8H7NLB6_BIOOC
MKNVQEFRIDEWIRSHGPSSKHGLAGSFTSALSVQDLKSLSADPDLEVIDSNLKLTYGVSRGSLKLREQIAKLHSSNEKQLTADNVLLTPGSIMANFLLLDTICGPGDHVICQYPTFGQLYLVPKYSGVDVELWKMDEDNEWQLKIEELSSLIKPNTKAIILNNPNNPTGAVLGKDFLEQVINIARKSDLVVFCDEVFSPMFFDDPKPPSLVSLDYKKAVVTGSMSKAFSLPGIRVGWIVTENDELLKNIAIKRDLTTVTVSQLDDSVASFALDPSVFPNLMHRNISLCKESRALLEDFVAANQGYVTGMTPAGSGTAFIKVLDADGKPVDDFAFCTSLAEKEEKDDGDFKGYFRITLGTPDVLKEALPALERFIRQRSF